MTRRVHPLLDGMPEAWAVEWGEDPYGAFVSFAVGDGVQRMRWIPPGRFVMGSPEGEMGRLGNEGPQHEVVLTKGYWLGETPVTQQLWEAAMGGNPSRFVGADHPVEQVSWEDCHTFIAKVNAKVPGLKARLPTEAEWEYACRAETTTTTWLGGDAASDLDRIAWYRENSERTTHPVRGKHANPYGLHDMLGNVWEWCSDWLGDYRATQAVNPVGAASGLERVIRGGSWGGVAKFVRAAMRGADDPGRRGFVLGFRLARGQ